MSALLLALTAISLSAQQTITLNRLGSCEDGVLKIRHMLGEANPHYQGHSTDPYPKGAHKKGKHRVQIKRGQMWTWQTPIMLSNFSILLFIVGLMIAIFARAVASHGDWSKGDSKIALFFGFAAIFAGTNYLFCWLCLNQGSLISASGPDPPLWQE